MIHCDWKSVLQDIFCPTIGSLWAAPNGIWNNSFAHNKEKEDCHPSVVGRTFNGCRSCWLIPGTSKKYRNGSDVYKVKINPDDPDCPVSHFLINLRMTYNSKDLLCLERGWNDVDSLNEQQTDDLKLQIKFCLGIDV